MKKIVVKLDLQDDKAKQKAMRTVSTLSGIDSISMDMKAKKLTVMGSVDPISIATKLRKYWPTTDIILVGPAKEPEKPAEAKEEAAKPNKEEGRDERKMEEGDKEAKKEEDGDDGKKKEEEKKPIVYDPVLEMVRAYKAYNPHMTSYYYVQSMEENPNACVIC